MEQVNWIYFWIGGVGGGLVMPAWLFWQRRRCLADDRFPKDENGKGIFAGQAVEEADQELLMGWQRRMVVTFIAGMALLPLLLLGLATLDFLRSPTGAYSLLALLILLAIAGVSLQLSARCPRCQFRIGLQSRLLLPKNCDRCGVAFRRQDGETAS